MLETLLKGIDSRLQKVSDDVGELKVTVTAIEKRLDKVEDRLDRVDKRLDRMDARFDRMDARFDTMEHTVTRMGQDILRLPTWKGVGAVAAAVLAACGGIVAWLASGGARALARLFE